MSGGEARVFFALRKSQYISLKHFGISTQHSQCAHMTSFTDKLNALKTDIHLNWSIENSVASSEKTQCICITNTNWFIMFRKIIATYSENRFVHIQSVAKCGVSLCHNMWYIQGVTELCLPILYSRSREILLYWPLAERKMRSQNKCWATDGNKKCGNHTVANCCK